MKMYLFQKQSIKENYRYFLSMLLATIFLILMFHVSISSPDHLNNVFLMSLFIAVILSCSVLSPVILFKNLYHETNVHHISSIPMTRMELFFSQYLIGIAFGLLLILSYTSLTVLVIGTQSSWIFQSSCLIVLFLFYYHLSLLAYWICGNKLFYTLMVLFFSFGPLLFYFIFTWMMQSFVFGYTYSELAFLNPEILFPLSSIVYSIFRDASVNYNLLFLLASVVMLVMTIVAVKYRHNERTGQSIGFRLLSLLIRLEISLLGVGIMISFIAAVTGYNLENAKIPMLFSFVLISMIVVYMVEMIYKKKSKVFYTLKYAFVIGIISYLGVYFATLYLEYYIPDEIESVYIYHNDGFQGKQRYFEVTDEKSIQKIKELQNKIVDEKEVLKYDGPSITFYISYNMPGGNQSNRYYPINEDFAKEYLPELLKEKQIFDAFTFAEQELIKQLDQNRFFEVYLSGVTYQIDTKEKCYLFKNYLNQEIEYAFSHPYSWIEDEFNNETSCYLEVSKIITKKDKEVFRIYGDNQRIRRALMKTFDLPEE